MQATVPARDRSRSAPILILVVFIVGVAMFLLGFTYQSM